MTEYLDTNGFFPLLLAPAAICFAISMYEQISWLKKHIGAILAGIPCGGVDYHEKTGG